MHESLRNELERWLDRWREKMLDSVSTACCVERLFARGLPPEQFHLLPEAVKEQIFNDLDFFAVVGKKISLVAHGDAIDESETCRSALAALSSAGIWPREGSLSESTRTDALCAALDVLPEDEARVLWLIALLGRDGHERHEDIVFELGLLGDPAAIPAIAAAITEPFPYLVEWGNVHEFQRKCAYALARIGTTESRAVLELLARNTDIRLRQYGNEGLDLWPLPFKRH